MFGFSCFTTAPKNLSAFDDRTDVRIMTYKALLESLLIKSDISRKKNSPLQSVNLVILYVLGYNYTLRDNLL
jgi:hypothetical protein